MSKEVTSSIAIFRDHSFCLIVISVGSVCDANKLCLMLLCMMDWILKERSFIERLMSFLLVVFVQAFFFFGDPIADNNLSEIQGQVTM